MIESTSLAMAADPIDSAPLFAQARAGDAESFWRLCAPLQPRLVRQALALCRDESLAQDLVQETLVAAWKSIRRYHGECQFATWLCSILFHKHKSTRRRSRWRRLISDFISDHDAVIGSMADRAPPPDDAALLSERSAQLLLALEQLPEKQREVVFLRFYAGESVPGIAAALHCSEGTVKSRLFHALENLRRMRLVREEFQ